MEFSTFASGTPAFQAPPDEPDLPEEDSKPDLTRADSYLLSNDWVNAEPSARGRMAEKASALQTEALINAKGGTIEMEVYRDGKKTRDQVAIHGPDGLLSQQARQYLDQSRQAMLRAAEDPDGGVMLNAFTDRLEAAPWINQLASSDPVRSEQDPDYARFNEFMAEKTALDSADKLQGLSFGEFKNWANEGETDPAKQVGDDPELLKKFNRHIKRSTYDPTSMGDSKAVDLVDGELAINPTNFFEIDQVEAEIQAQQMSPSQKRLALMDYHAKVNEKIMDGARIFSAADAGPLEAVVNRPLVNDLSAHLQAGGTGIDFLRANKDRMSRDSYSAWSETAATFRDALFATGTGATWLAGAALDILPGVSGMGESLSLPAQLWGEMAEETAQAYRNPVAFSIGSVDINRRDLTSLTGQIGSFLALGGLGSAATKAVGLTTAKQALVAGTAKATTGFGASLAKMTGGKLGEKTATFLVDTATDATAYLGGVQAAGMSFGSTHNAVMQATGDEKEAYRAASIQGISDGLGALIATSVMNRVAPGAERLLGVKPGKLGGSLVQRVRAAKENTAGLAGMLQAKEGLEKLSPELLKQFGKDMRASMRQTASNAGMRGIGIGGDVLAEFGEEALDEALSDVIGMVIDDSKSWSAGDWGNIHDNFRDYLKAGVLGALGGAMGGAKDAIGSGFKALGSDTERKAEVKRVIEGEWKLIKQNVKESFADRENLVQGLGGKAVKLAEVLADDSIPLKEKSALLVSAARSGKLTPSMEMTVPKAPEAAPEEDKEKAPAAKGSEPKVPKTELSEEPTEMAPRDAIKQIAQLPAGRRIKDDVRIEELKPVKTKDVEFIPLKIGSVSYAGAKVVSYDAQGRKQVTYLNAKQAAEQASDKGLKQAFQSTVDQDGSGLDGKTNAETWSEEDGSPAAASSTEGQRRNPPEVEAEYSKLTEDELFSRAKWEQDPDSLGEENIEPTRAKKRALIEIARRPGLQEKFEKSKLDNDTDQRADNVAVDEQDPSAKPEGAGVDATAEVGRDQQDAGNRPAGEGSGGEAAPAAAAEVTPGKNNIAGIEESSPDVSEEVGKIISTGGSIDSVDSWEEAVERFDFPPAGQVASPLAVAYRKANGQIGVVVFPAGRKLSPKELAETLRHERIHLEQYAFEDSPEGKAALAKAAPSFDRKSPSFDRKLDARMRRDYQGWDGMDLAGKVRESSRALIEDMLDGKSPEAEAGFLAYLKSLLQHLQQVFAGDPVMLDYVNGVAARLEASAASVAPSMTLPALEATLKFKQGLKWTEKARDAAEQLASNRASYPGNDDVWRRKSDNQLFFAPGFLQRVLDNPGIPDPVTFVKDSVAALDAGKSLPVFPAASVATPAAEEVVPFEEATEPVEEVLPEAEPEAIEAELEQEETKLEELPAESTVEEVREVAPQLVDTATLAALNAPDRESFLTWLKGFSKGLSRFGDKIWRAAKAMAVALAGISVAPQATNHEIASVAQVSPELVEVVSGSLPNWATPSDVSIEAEFSDGTLPLPLNETDNVAALDVSTLPQPALVSIDVPQPRQVIKNVPAPKVGSVEATQSLIDEMSLGNVGTTLPGGLAKWWLKQGKNPAVNAAAALLGEHEKGSSRIKSMLVSMGVSENPSSFPWCSAFLSWSLNQAGLKTKTMSSRAFLGLGQKTTAPAYGDVVVLWNDNPATGGKDGWGGHTGFYLGETDTHVIVLSGNSGDSVDVSAFVKTRVLGYRTFGETPGLLASNGRTKRRSRSRKNKPALGALATETAVEPMPETKPDPRYVVLESELETPTENGSWKRDDDLYYFTPGKGRTLALAPGEMLALDGSPDSRLFLMSVSEGVWLFKRMELADLASNWSDGKFEEGVESFQREWAQTRLGASAQRMGPLLDALLDGSLATGKGSAFETAFLDILRTVAPNADAPVRTTMKGGNFLQARAKVLPATRRFATVEEARKELARLQADPELKRLEKELKQLRASLPNAADASRNAADEVAAEVEAKLAGMKQTAEELSEQIATGSWKDARAEPGVLLQMEVDYPKLVKMLAKKLGTVNLSDPRIRPLVALEASRLLAKWIDEEQIHIITLNEEKFPREMIEKFYDEVASDPAHPFHGLLVDTVRERFPDQRVTGDYAEAGALLGDDIYVAGSEFLRKLHQLRIGGATSEMAAYQAGLLNKAIKADLATGDKPNLLKVIGELLRRYTDRLRLVLNIRWAISRLPETQRNLLNRLNEEYLSAGLMGDVDLVRKKLLTSTRKRMQLSTSDMEETLNDVGKVYSDALVKLRELANEFVNIGVDDFLVFDEKVGLRLHPDVATFVSESKDYDLPAIEDALDALHEANSFQMAWMDAHFAREAMEAAELALDFNPSELLDPTRSFDPAGMMAAIVKGSPRGEVETSPLLRQLRDSIAGLDGQIKLNQAYLLGSALRDVRDMNPEKFADRRQLLQRAKMLGIKPTREFLGGERSFVRLKDSIETYIESLGAQSEYRPWEGSYDPKVTPSWIEGMVEGPDLPATAWTLGNEQQSAEAVSSFGDAQQALRELRLERQRQMDQANLLRDVLRAADQSGDATIEFNRDIQSTAEVLRLRDQLRQTASGVNMEVAKERYRQFKAYLDAVEEYNKRVNFMTQRAIGSFDFDSKDYALFFQDTQHGQDDDRTVPIYGKKSKKQDPSQRAVRPSDVYGHDVVLAQKSVGLGQLPGQAFPRNAPKKASLEEKEIWQAIKRTVESNAAFLGREARKNFFIADMMQRFKAGFDRDGYNAGAGFVLDYTEDEDTGRRTYETADEAFPGFDGLDVMFSIDRKLDAEEAATSNKEQKDNFELQSMLNFVNYITKAERWLKHVRERAGLEDDIPLNRTQSEFVAEMDGFQTPAARAQLLLEPVLKDLANQVDNLRRQFVSAMEPHFFYQVAPGKNFLESFQRKEDGSLRLKGDMTSAIKAFKTMLPPSTTGAFKIAVEATLGAQSAVSLTRRMLKEFNNQRWQKNIEDEAIRTVRDAAYVPEHSEFLQLRDAAFDLVTARNLEFNLNYLATYPGTYSVARAYAYEMVEQYRKVNKGSGVEPFMKMVRARLASGRQVGVVQGSVPASEQDQFDFAEAGFLQTRIPTSVAMEGINPESDVLGINDLGPEGQAYSVSSSGETGGDFTSNTTEKVGEGVSTQAEKAARQQDMLNQARIKRLTTWLTLIGYQINAYEGNVEDSRKFRGDVLRKGLTGEGDVQELVVRGIKGLFTATRNRPDVLEPLIERFYEENPHWKINSRDYSPNYGQDPTPGAERVDYEGQQGSFDPELFAVELLEFKAQFERKAIEEAKVTNNSQIASALATVLRVGVAGVTNLDIDPKAKELTAGQRLVLDFKDFAEAHQQEHKQALFGRDEQSISHVTPDDAAAVARLIRRAMTQGGLGVLDAALVTTEDTWLTTNPFLSLLLTNLPSTRLVNGKRVPVQTLLVTVPESLMGISQAEQIGPRLFPGKDGMPNVVYVPLTDTGRSDAQAMMQQALLVYGEDPAMKQQISDLAAKLRLTLDPGFSPDTGTMLWNNLGQLDLLRGQFQEQVLAMEPKDRVQFDRLLMDHVRRSSASLAESAITEGEVKGTGFGSDVLLVSLVLTDPSYKRAFDQAYIGTDRDMDLGLPESAAVALQTALQQAAGTGMDHEPIFDDAMPDDAPGAVNVMPDARPLIDLLDPSRMKPIDSRPDLAVTPPSDSLLFNLLGGLLVSAKQSNLRLLPPNTDASLRRNRDINRQIYEQRTAKEELENSADPLAAPVFADKNRGTWGDVRNRYVGSILNLTNPGSLGIGPMTNAMNQVRVSTQTAALLAQLPSLRSSINSQVRRLVNQQKNGKLKEVLRHQIELTDKTLAELASMLPPQLALELAAERQLMEEGLTALDETLVLNEARIARAEEVLTKEPDGSLMLQRWQKKLKQRDAALTAKLKTAKLGSVAYVQAEEERLQVRALLKKKDLGDLITLSDLESSAIKQKLADLITFLASDLSGEAYGLAAMEGKLAEASIRARLEKQFPNLLPKMQGRLQEMQGLLRELRSVPEGELINVVGGINERLEEHIKWFNKSLEWVNAVALDEVNIRLAGLGLPPRNGRAVREFRLDDVTKLKPEAVDAMMKRLADGLSQANTSDSIFEGTLDWAAKEFKTGISELTGLPIGKKSKKQLPEDKRANLEALRRFMQSVEGRSKREIFTAIDMMLPSVEEGDQNRLDKVLQMLVLSTAEGQALIDNRTSTAAEEKAKRAAENDIIEATRENNRIRREREEMLRGDGVFYVGRYRHLSDQLGFDRKPLSVQVGVELVAEGMKFDPMAKLNRQEQNERNTKLEEWGNDIGRRQKYHVDKEALRRVLKRHSEDRVDEHYKKLRGQLDNFNTFDPSRMINEAMERVRIEDAVLKSRFDQAASDAEKAEARGVSKEALEMLLEHKKGFYTGEKDNKQTRRAKWHLNPKNVQDRRRLTGTLIDDGIPVVLMAVDARERLLRAFPGRTTSQNVNRKVNDIVLRALGDRDGSGVFMQQTMSGQTKSAFTALGFKLTDGKNLNVEQAGKEFSAKFTAKLGGWLNRSRGSEVDLTGSNSQRSVEFFSSLVEQLVQVYQHQGLRNRKGELNPVGEKVKALLDSIDQGDFADNDTALQNLNLIGVYAEAFAELESANIMDKLVSGLSVHDDFASLTMMKAFHHQDARVRMRFIKDHVARETAVHLQAFLEKGFDNGKSGREGGHTAREAAREKIAEAAGKLKRNALDQTIGYVLAQLDGLADNNGLGLSQSLGAWARDFSDSYKDLLQLEVAQKNRWKGRTGPAARFLWANHVELIRDIPLARRVIQIMKESGAMGQFMSITYDKSKPEQQFDRDENARNVIRALREALLKNATNKLEVEAYAKTIHETLRDTYNATAVTLALLSKPQGELTGELDEDGNPTSWKNRSIEPRKKTYGSVPLRMAYAANPDSDKPRKVREGKWIPDPADTVSITDSAFFGGAGKRESNRQKASVFRPLAINGLAAPLSILEDSLYRINVAPNYEVLRRLTGKVETQSGIPKVGDSMMINSASRNTEGDDDYSQEWNIAMAAVATEVENNIFNDGRIGVVNTGFSQAMTFLASTYVVRALSSIQQIWNQVLPPVALFVTKKLLTGQYQEASDFLKILSQSIGSMVTRGEFHGKLNDFTKRVSPFIHFRGVDGQDVARNELRSQLRYVDPKGNQLTGKAKQLSGLFVKEYENLGERALNVVIGSGERLVSRAIFAAELMSEMRNRNEGGGPTTVEELFDQKTYQIPVVANEMARIKVSDMMGQSDQSKKSLLFQSHSDSPVWSSLLKSLVRFSNHTATTSSNMTAFMPGLLVKDQRTRREAQENIIGTIGQNVVFHFAKIQTLVPLLAYAFYLADGDDDDKAARKAQLFADDWLSSEGDDKLVGFGKDFVFGSQKQLFSDKKTASAAQGSALAMLTSKVGLEMVAATPVLGVMAGYSPISSLLARNFINPASEQLASAVTDVEVANAWYEKTRLGVFEYTGGGVENLADITAPTSVLYDALAAPKLAFDAHPTANSFDVGLYLASELLAPVRDYRSARRKEMREAAKKEEKKNR